MGRLSLLVTDIKTIVILMMITVAFIIVDSTIIKFVAFGNEELSAQSNVTIFIIISTIFVGISIYLLKLINEGQSKNRYINQQILRYSYNIVSIVQYAIISLLVLIIMQMVFFNNYSILLVLLEIQIIHISAAFFLGFLVLALVKWFRSNKNRVVLLYAISFSLLTSNILVSLIYLTYDYSYHNPYKKPYSIHMFLLNLPRSDLVKTFGPLLDILLLMSFLATWVATTDLLSQYRRRLGKMRYWILMSIPLLYFVFPFETYFFNITHRFMIESPVLSGLLYILTFSATKQVGGILFATVFITASIIIKRPDLKNSLLKSAVGVAVLFSSMEIDTLVYAVYPPFGLVTIFLMPIGACLILNGILMSARWMSLDAELRKEVYSSAESQLNLLRTIGITQMETQLVNNCRHLFKRFSALEMSEADKELDQEEMKQVVRDVLNELQSKMNRGTKNDQH